MAALRMTREEMVMAALKRPGLQRAAPRLRDAGHAGLHRLQVDDVEQRAVGQQRRQDGVPDHVGVGDADVLGHDEGGRAHHRRHQLAVDAGGALDGAGLRRRVADALHERDGEHARRHHVGDRGAGDHAGHAGGDDGGLGRPAAEAAEQREGDLDEVVAGAGLLQQRAEQHEQEDEGGGDAERHAEHALRGDPEVRGGAAERGALVRHQARQIGAQEHVGQHRQRDHRHPRAFGAPRGLDQQHDADDGDEDVGERRQARAQNEVAIEHDEIEHAGDRRRRQGPVDERHVVARRGLEGRVAGEGQEQREAQMKAARLGVAEHAEAEHEGQRRGIPELEQRPRHGHRHDGLGGKPGRLAPADVGLGHQLLEVGLAGARRCTIRRHDRSALAVKRLGAPTPAPRRQT